MDLIDREQAMGALDALCDRVCEYSKEQRTVMCGACTLGSAFDVLEELPSARPKGKWIESTESRFRPFMCSACGCIYDVDTVMGKPIWNFCPKCGSDMREVE